MDDFCWLIKVTYSDREELSKRRFRLDRLFAAYIRHAKHSPEKLGRVFVGANQWTGNAKAVIDDLKRGWYNEMAYAFPLRPATLGLSFCDVEANKVMSSSRFAFPSWRIVTAYYSMYFCLRAITLMKVSSFRLEEHGKTLVVFKNNVFDSLSERIWKFPFDIAYRPGRRVERARLPLRGLDYLRYGYARHPRPPHLAPEEVFNSIYKRFRRRGARRKATGMYTLFDYMRDFRVWANYQDIDNLMNLFGSGWKALMDQNLALIVFFVGGIAELCVGSLFGDEVYVKLLERVYRLMGDSDPEMRYGFVKSPLYQRNVIYRKIGLVEDVVSVAAKVNRHEVGDLSEGLERA